MAETPSPTSSVSPTLGAQQLRVENAKGATAYNEAIAACTPRASSVGTVVNDATIGGIGGFGAGALLGLIPEAPWLAPVLAAVGVLAGAGYGKHQANNGVLKPPTGADDDCIRAHLKKGPSPQ